MTLSKRWSKKKVAISGPEQLVHTGHGSHNDITQKLHGLPPEWVQILRDNGVVGEDLVLVKKSKSDGPYGNGFFNISSSSLMSNRSLQKLWKTMSGRSGRESLDENDVSSEALRSLTLEKSTASRLLSTPASSTIPQDESPLSLADTASPEILQSSSISRQSTLNPVQEVAFTGEEPAQKFGLPFRHKDFQENSPDIFKVLDSLGHGSLGVVEEVRISPSYSSFVRKRVQIPYYKRKQYLKIINQEAQVLRSLDHCHIVKMIGSYSEVPDSGRQFFSLLMAPVGQRDLKTFLDMVGDKYASKSAELYKDSTAWLRTWFKCLSSALAYIHSKGVRHQDIKPSNIIHREHTVYFTDFSSASEFQVGQTTSTENPARTSAMYAAPEVVDSEEGLARHGRGTDVFALGAVFTEMLAVLRGASIDEYYQALVRPDIGRHGGASQNVIRANRQTFLYGRVLTEVEAFFAEDDFFHTCISNLLQSDRDHRPDAQEAAKQIRNFLPWTLKGCACDLEEESHG